MNYLRTLFLPVLLIIALCMPSSATAHVNSPFASADHEPLTELFLQFITRPGITDNSDIRALRPAAHEAALAFRKSLFPGPGSTIEWHRFRNDVALIVQAYQKEYGQALAGIAGAEAKGAAIDHLLENLIQSSVQSGIPPEELDMALLRGAAAIESRISEPPLAKKLSLADGELVILLLRTMVYQDRRRILLDSTSAALQYLHTDAGVISLYDGKIISALRPILSRELVCLEKNLEDPLFIIDIHRIVTGEYDVESNSDLFAWKYGIELSSLSFSLQQISLISSLAALMPGMTAEVLQEQLGRTTITDLAAYAAVNPQLPLNYLPVDGLADKLAALGETPPSPPDFSLFPYPYRALIQMRYDIQLCVRITAKEWYLANNAFQGNAPIPSLGEQLILKEAAMTRLSQVKANIRGVSKNAAEAFSILFGYALILMI